MSLFHSNTRSPLGTQRVVKGTNDQGCWESADPIAGRMYTRDLNRKTSKYNRDVRMRVVDLERLACVGVDCKAGRMGRNHEE